MRCRSISRAARRPPETGTTRWPPARATSARSIVVDTTGKASLLTLVCSRSRPSARLEGLDRAGARPFCTADGVGAVLSVIGPRDSRQRHPTHRVVSVNEPCASTKRPFLATTRGVRVECAKADGADYAPAQIVPDPRRRTRSTRGAGRRRDRQRQRTGSATSRRPTPTCRSPGRRARGIGADDVRRWSRRQHRGRTLGFLGEPRVNVSNSTPKSRVGPAGRPPVDGGG